MSLISELRMRITDQRYCLRAFGLAVTDPDATTAIAEITDGHLIVTTAGGVTGIDLDLRHHLFDTVEKVHQVISRTPGYRVSLDEDANPDHPSLDFQPFGPTSILGVGVDILHHRFSDQELESHLRSAIKRHNPSFTLQTVPPDEETFVITLAQAGINRVLATDASKRKGMDSEIFYLIELANSLERTYDKDTKRLFRALQSPKEASPNDMGAGDIVIGSYCRFNLRTGRMSPNATNIPPMPAELLPFLDDDIGDGEVLARWKRNRDTDFHSLEVWMSHTPEVERARQGVRLGPSLRVFPGEGQGEGVQNVTSCLVGKLEPETTYYFRSFVIDSNGEVVGSGVEQVTTKALRARFAATGPLSSIIGPPGTVVTVTLDSSKGVITQQHILTVGVKEVPIVLVDDFHFTFTVPSFVNKGEKILLLMSPNGLSSECVSTFEVI